MICHCDIHSQTLKGGKSWKRLGRWGWLGRMGGNQLLSQTWLHLFFAPPPPPPIRVKSWQPKSTTPALGHPAVRHMLNQQWTNSSFLWSHSSSERKKGIVHHVARFKRFACQSLLQCKKKTNVTFSFGMFFIPPYLCWVDGCSHLFLESVCESHICLFGCCARQRFATKDPARVLSAELVLSVENKQLFKSVILRP